MKRLFFLVMQFLLNRKRNSIIRQAVTPGMSIIGDFGCGHFPNKHANVFIDQVGSDDVQRGGLGISKAQAKQFRSIDLNAFPYPFKDKEFDFIICTHVLEHLDDPVRTCCEFSRIAKAGYIEVPNYCADLFVRNNDVIHKWLCTYQELGKVLAFIERKRFLRAMPPGVINIFMRFLLQLDNIGFTWKDGIAATYIAFPDESVEAGRP